MIGRRLADAPIGEFPIDYDDLRPGDFWRVLTREKTIDGEPCPSRPLDVLNHEEDRAWWGATAGYEGNLTGGVWGLMTPLRQYAVLSIHTVREHDDGTISVLPGDGSSNSILVTGPGDQTWHGYIYNGEWREC